MFRSTFLMITLFWTAILYGMVYAGPVSGFSHLNPSMSSLHDHPSSFKNTLLPTQNLTHAKEIKPQQIIANLEKCVHGMHMIEALNKNSNTSDVPKAQGEMIAKQ